MQAPGLPDLTSAYPLSAEQIAEYGRNGHIRLRALASPEEAASFREAIVEATMAHSRETRPIEERDTYGRAFIQVTNLWEKDERVRRFVFSRRFAQVAAALMQVPSVRLYHDQALFKEPGGGHTPWHQDQYYWPLDTDRTITMWMPLVDVPAEMGTMTFASGSEAEGYVAAKEISDESEAYYDAYVAERGFPLVTHGAMAAGDATFHSGYTLHRAPGNPTGRVREVMTVIYFPDGTRVLEPDNEWRAVDKRAFLDDLPGGAPAAGSLNPILFP